MAVKNVQLKSIQFNLRVLGKGVWRDLKSINRYKVRLFGWLLSVTIGLASAFLFGLLFQFNSTTTVTSGIESDQVFVFFAGGIALSTFADTAVWAPTNRVNRDIHFGTLEAIFVTPASRMMYLLAPCISDATINLIFFLPAYVVIMGVFGTLTNLYVIVTTLIIIIITIISAISFGIFFAMISILLRRSNAIAGFLNQLFMFLCGAYVPVQAFIGVHPISGRILQYIAMVFPYTYCYDLFRFYTFGNSYITLLPVWIEFLVITVATGGFLVLASVLLKIVEQRAKQKGLSIL